VWSSLKLEGGVLPFMFILFDCLHALCLLLLAPTPFLLGGKILLSEECKNGTIYRHKQAEVTMSTVIRNSDNVGNQSTSTNIEDLIANHVLLSVCCCLQQQYHFVLP